MAITDTAEEYAGELVGDKFTQATAYANTAFNTAIEYLQNLGGLADMDYAMQTVSIAIPAVPVAPSLPDTPDTSDLDDIVQDLIDNATGIDPAIEEAIWERGRIRMNEERARAIEEAHEAAAARGFSLPTGALAGYQATIEAEHAKRLEELNWQIIEEVIRLSQQNQFKSVEYWISKAEMEVKAYLAQVGALVDNYKAQGGVFEAIVSARAKEADAFIAEAQGTLQNNLAQIELQAEITKAGAQVAAQLAASAMGAVNASASYGYSGTDHYGRSYSESESISTNISISGTAD